MHKCYILVKQLLCEKKKTLYDLAHAVFFQRYAVVSSELARNRDFT